MEPEVTKSARRHGIAKADTLHAFRNFVRVFEEDGLTMLVGPDRTGRLIEVGVSVRTGEPRIVHSMPARAKYLR